MEWTIEWPSEPGYYWFYGWAFTDRSRDPELHFVKVRGIAQGKLMYVTNGHFLFKQEGGEGYWMPVTLPELPE